MTWPLLPTISDLPAGGTIRSVGPVDRRAYHRAYWHARRKGHYTQTYTPEQLARRMANRRIQYQANIERERANGRARYWKNRDRYAAAARERAKARR